MELRNKRLTDEEFFRERKEVLAQWPTGKDVDLEEGVEFHKSLPPSKVYPKRLAEAKRNGDTLLRCFIGTPTLEMQMEHVRCVVEEGGADLSNTHLDAFTRNLMFERAEQAVKESIRRDKALLNGFPIVIHGVATTRKLVESTPVPTEITGCSPDWRLTTEIGLAAGHTSTDMSAFHPIFNYNRDTLMETALHNLQYRARLIGYYGERGCPIIDAPVGPATILCPPSLTNAAQIVEILMCAEQGVKHFCIGSVGVNLTQAFADAYVQPRMAREYLDRFGYKDVEIFTAPGGIYVGRYPVDPGGAFAVLGTTPVVAALTGGQKTHAQTIDESHQLPTIEGKIASLRHAKMLINLYKGQKLNLEEMKAVKAESRELELEIRAIVERVLELGDGDVAVGAVRAVEAGVIDVPFASYRYAARKVMGVRDAQGAGRFLDPGNLPFGKEILEFHKEKIAERAKKENRDIAYEAVCEGFLSISEEGVLVGS